ncbi:hypothetical protein [Singulisphaera sp. PoT]|uniref:hypothetical protein n=1 Tax=Singulisphaera sp. PoT TaxID=3411797 RepID=UPI003BF5315C
MDSISESERSLLAGLLSAWVVRQRDHVKLGMFGPSWGGWLFVVKRACSGEEPRSIALSLNRLKLTIRDRFPDLPFVAMSVPSDTDLQRWLNLQESITFDRSSPAAEIGRN